MIDPAPARPFPPGHVRNLGAAVATGDYLLFYDVDLCCGPGFVDGVRRWITAGPGPTDFLMAPCLYLSEQGTARLRFVGAPVDLSPHLASALGGDNAMVDHFAVSTSTVVVAAAHFRRLGGNRAEYAGHGCEDFDMLHRLASYSPRGRRPADYYVDQRTRFPGDYQGFRAYFLQYALPHVFGDLLTAHLWHPRPIHRRYFRQREHNEALLQAKMREHDALPAMPPLPAPWATGDAPEALPPRQLIPKVMAELGRDVVAQPGLLRWQPGVTPHVVALRNRARKLVRPRELMLDARGAAQRLLARTRRG